MTAVSPEACAAGLEKDDIQDSRLASASVDLSAEVIVPQKSASQVIDEDDQF